ncbi:lipase secretion chaperone [Piscinibacter gummiphilus]|uniref:Lipase helper protein n=1 Tax=Piscinibacter gummiphilus TaxID=946333 RepID=A0ABZ0CZX3_9BURK|nr:lipase secretion chaperone [Piscinibacter gummiphilus]WOB10539.1 lipase secretion chaperone [Piscinibacter gummiphilus]
MAVHLNIAPWWKRRSVLAVLGIALVGSAAAVLWFGGANEPPAAPEGIHANTSNTKASGFDSTSAGARDSGGNPALVEVDVLGTRMDVSRLFQLGFGGGLNVDADTRATLDTLMVQMSDPPTPEETAKLEYTLRQGLPKEEAEKALKLLQGYRSYQADLRTEGAQLAIPETAASVDDYFAKVALIQRRHFDDNTASALFGQDLRNARAVMMAAVIDQNPNLTPAQKKEQIDALRATLPPEQRGIVPEPSEGAASEAK